MIEKTRREIPADHPIRALFQQLTERGLGQLNLHDPDTIQYVTNLLTDFVHVQNVRPINFVSHDTAEMSPELRRDYYKHVGDITLFNLGLFPESLNYGRHTVSMSYYAQTGRRSYTIVAEMDSSSGGTRVYRKLSEQFEQCVGGLNWVKLYINDPFYQYMFREFDIT